MINSKTPPQKGITMNAKHLLLAVALLAALLCILTANIGTLPIFFFLVLYYSGFGYLMLNQEK